MTGTFLIPWWCVRSRGWSSPVPVYWAQWTPRGAPLMGAPLTIAAFEAALGPVGGWVVTGSIVLFAFFHHPGLGILWENRWNT